MCVSSVYVAVSMLIKKRLTQYHSWDDRLDIIYFHQGILLEGIFPCSWVHAGLVDKSYTDFHAEEKRQN